MEVEVPPSKVRPISSKESYELSKRIGLWLALIAFLHGLLYLALTPPWQTPDEPQHFQYVRFLSDERRLPTRDDAATDTLLTEQVRQSMAQSDFWAWRDRDTVPSDLEYRMAWGHPPLYYSLAAIELAPFVSSDVTTQLYIVRLLSVTLTALTVWVSFLAMRSLFPGSPILAIAVPLFIALLPMYAFIGSSVNNDVLAALAGTLVIWLLIESFRRGLTWHRGALLLVLLAAALLTKRTTFFLVPLTVFALFILLPPAQRRWVVVIGVLAIPLWLILLRQDPASYIGALLRRPGNISQFFTTPSSSDIALWGALLFTTFWGNFGWATIQLDMVWYGLLLIVTLISVTGWIRLGWHRRRSIHTLAPWQRWALAMCALAVLLISVQTAGLILTSGIHQQARYLFPAILPLALFLVLGWGAWVPSYWHSRAMLIGIAAIVVFDLISLVFYQLPFYYG